MPHLSFAAARAPPKDCCVALVLRLRVDDFGAAAAAESSRWVYWGPRVELIAVMKERAARWFTAARVAAALIEWNIKHDVWYFAAGSRLHAAASAPIRHYYNL
jgi:hypothetical protein